MNFKIILIFSVCCRLCYSAINYKLLCVVKTSCVVVIIIMSEQLPLKYEKIEPKYLIRGDIILHEGELWQCALKNASIFLNLETKEQKEINRQWYLRVSRLQLIPHEWKVVDGKVKLKGQQLGLGPLHDIQLEGMRTFEQMQIVKSQAEKGKKVDYKIVAVETQQKNKYLLVAIQFL